MRNYFHWTTSVGAVLLAWQSVYWLQIFHPFLLPSPVSVLQTVIVLFVSGSVLPDLAATMVRVFEGLALAAFFGIPIGIVMGYSTRVYRSLEFLVDFFRSMPATALVPLCIMFFGIGEMPRVVLIAFSCGLIMLVNTTYGVRNANKIRIMVAKSLHAGDIAILRKVLLPESLPFIFSGARIAISLALILEIVTGMIIGGNTGLGVRIVNAQLTFDATTLYALIIIIGLLGYTINKAYVTVERRIVHWSGK